MSRYFLVFRKRMPIPNPMASEMNIRIQTGHSSSSPVTSSMLSSLSGLSSDAYEAM